MYQDTEINKIQVFFFFLLQGTGFIVEADIINKGNTSCKCHDESVQCTVGI